MLGKHNTFKPRAKLSTFFTRFTLVSETEKKQKKPNQKKPNGFKYRNHWKWWQLPPHQTFHLLQGNSSWPEEEEMPGLCYKIPVQRQVWHPRCLECFNCQHDLGLCLLARSSTRAHTHHTHRHAHTKATKSPQDTEERGVGGKNNLEINLPTSKPTNTDAMCAGASAAVFGKITGPRIVCKSVFCTEYLLSLRKHI